MPSSVTGLQDDLQRLYDDCLRDWLSMSCRHRFQRHSYIDRLIVTRTFQSGD